jgi:segregation and condensation protein B
MRDAFGFLQYTAVADPVPSITSIVEAILFVADAPITASDIATALSNSPAFADLAEDELSFQETVQSAITEVQNKYQANPEAAFELKPIGGGYQFFSKAAYAPFVREAIVTREAKKLSRTVLETLAIIAYRQPVSKSEVDYIRGVDCGYAITKLLEKQLVEPSGRADTPGRPLLYRTSAFFMEYFGLSSIDELPKPKELATEEESMELLYRNRNLAEDFEPSTSADVAHITPGSN